MSNEDPVFDVDEFMNAEHHVSGGLATKYEVIPEGVYRAFVNDVTVRSGRVKKEESKRFGEPWASLEVRWEIEDEALKAKFEQEVVIAFQSIMLNLTNDSPPRIAKKNVELGRTMEVLGLNAEVLNFGAMRGRPALVRIEHEIYRGEPKARVTSIAKR